MACSGLDTVIYVMTLLGNFLLSRIVKGQVKCMHTFKKVDMLPNYVFVSGVLICMLIIFQFNIRIMYKFQYILTVMNNISKEVF